VRHLFFAGTVGFLIPVADRVELQLLGEAGGHRVSGTRFGPLKVPADRGATSPIIDAYYGTNPASAPFAGVRPSLELLLPPLMIGVGGWVHVDLLDLSPEPYVDSIVLSGPGAAKLNRLSLGADLHVAFRFH